MPKTTRRAVRRPSAPRSLRPVATTTSESPDGTPGLPWLIEDFKFVIPPMPRPRGLQEGPQRLDRASLPANHPSDLRGLDGQLEHLNPVLLERTHRDRLGIVDEVPGKRLDPPFQIRLRPVRLHHVDLDDLRLPLRIVVADLVRDSRARRARRLGHHDTVKRLVLRPRPAQANHQHSVTSPRFTAPNGRLSA